MKKSINYLAVISCLALSASFAHAEPMGHGEHMSGEPMHEPDGGKYFKTMDSNGDGLISKAEFDAAHDKHFKNMDTNNDGKLSLEEMQAGHNSQAKEGFKERFDKADANHDGALSRDEAKEMPMVARNFDELDANKDGKVTREEMKAGWEKKRKAGGEKQSSGW